MNMQKKLAIKTLTGIMPHYNNSMQTWQLSWYVGCNTYFVSFDKNDTFDTIVKKYEQNKILVGKGA